MALRSVLNENAFSGKKRFFLSVFSRRFRFKEVSRNDLMLMHLHIVCIRYDLSNNETNRRCLWKLK